MKSYTTGDVTIEWDNFKPATVRYKGIESQIDFSKMITKKDKGSVMKMDRAMKNIGDSLNRISGMVDLKYLAGVKNIVINPKYFLAGDEYMGSYSAPNTLRDNNPNKDVGDLNVNYSQMLKDNQEWIITDLTLLHELTHVVDLSKYNLPQDLMTFDTKQKTEQRSFLTEMRYINKILPNYTDDKSKKVLGELYSNANKSFIEWGGVYH